MQRESTERLSESLSHLQDRDDIHERLHVSILKSEWQHSEVSSQPSDAIKVKASEEDGEKPSRPLNAYNLFFRLQRDRILRGDDKAFISEEDVANISNTKRYESGKRQHRRTHGKIGFTDLSKTISSQWKCLDADMKILFERRAAHEKVLYVKELKRWTKLMRRKKREKAKERKAEMDNACQPTSKHNRCPSIDTFLDPTFGVDVCDLSEGGIEDIDWETPSYIRHTKKCNHNGRSENTFVEDPSSNEDLVRQSFHNERVLDVRPSESFKRNELRCENEVHWGYLVPPQKQMNSSTSYTRSEEPRDGLLSYDPPHDFHAFEVVDYDPEYDINRELRMRLLGRHETSYDIRNSRAVPVPSSILGESFSSRMSEMEESENHSSYSSGWSVGCGEFSPRPSTHRVIESNKNAFEASVPVTPYIDETFWPSNKSHGHFHDQIYDTDALHARALERRYSAFQDRQLMYEMNDCFFN